MNKISKFLLGIFALGIATSCSEPNDEITSLGVSRNFAPVALTAKVINKTNVKLEWNKSDAKSYTIEVFYEDAEFAGTPVKTITGLTNDDIPYTVTGLEGETNYYFRVKAVGNNLSDSKWSTVSAVTDSEQIFYAVDEENDVTANAITVRWPAGQNATNITVTPGDIDYPVTAADIAAGSATISGLTAETEYTFKLMNGTKTRGTIKAKTAIDLGGAILVKAGDDLKAKLDAAADGDVFAFMPGTYSILNEEGKATTYTLTKSISFKSVRSYDRATIKAGFALSKGTDLTMTQVVFDGDKNVEIGVDYTDATSDTEIKLTFEDCEMTGFKKDFIFDGKKDIIVSITMNNCLIHDMPLSQRFIDFQGGTCSKIEITNSTISTIGGGDSFMRLDNKGSYSNKPDITISHCTINNIGSLGKGFFYARKGGENGQNIIFSNNIVSNSKFIFCNFTPYSTPAFDNNNYYNSPNCVEATKEDAAKYWDNGGTAYDPQYADAEKNDFTVGSDDVKALKIGDPRWIK